MPVQADACLGQVQRACQKSQLLETEATVLGSWLLTPAGFGKSPRLARTGCNLLAQHKSIAGTSGINVNPNPHTSLYLGQAALMSTSIRNRTHIVSYFLGHNALLSAPTVAKVRANSFTGINVVSYCQKRDSLSSKPPGMSGRILRFPSGPRTSGWLSKLLHHSNLLIARLLVMGLCLSLTALLVMLIAWRPELLLTSGIMAMIVWLE